MPGGAVPEALNAFSSWVQLAVKGATPFSTNISGGDPFYGTKPTQAGGNAENAMLWAKRVIAQADPVGGAIRYRYDGGSTALIGTTGMILTGGDALVLEGWQNIRRFVFASNQEVAGRLIITAEREDP